MENEFLRLGQRRINIWSFREAVAPWEWGKRKKWYLIYNAFDWLMYWYLTMFFYVYCVALPGGLTFPRRRSVWRKAERSDPTKKHISNRNDEPYWSSLRFWWNCCKNYYLKVTIFIWTIFENGPTGFRVKS